MLSFSSFIFYRILFWVRYNFLSVFISPLLHLFSISFFWRHFLLSNNISIFPIIFPFLHIIQKLQNFFLSASFLSLQFTKPFPLNFSFLISPFHLPFPPPTILLSLFSITRNLFLSLPLLPTKLTPHVHILLSQTRFFIGASLLTLPLEHPPHPLLSARRAASSERVGGARCRAHWRRPAARIIPRAFFRVDLCRGTRHGPAFWERIPAPARDWCVYTRTVHWMETTSCEPGQVRVTGSKDKSRVIVVYSDRTIRCNV